MHLDSDGPDPSRPARLWTLLVLAGALVLLGVANREDRELALELLGAGAFCAALFFLPGLRELISRWPSRH